MNYKTFLVATLLVTSGLATAKDGDPIRVGVDVPYPPFEMRQPDGSLTGFEIELGNAVCQIVTEQDCEWVVQAWDGIIPGLLARKYDMIISSMSINEERKKRVAFSDPYYNIPSAFFSPSKRKFDPSVEGVRLGVQRATIQDTYLTEYYPNAEVVRYGAANDAVVDLIGERIDALFIGAPVGMELLSDAPQIVMTGDLVNQPASIFGAGVGAAVRKRDEQLQTSVNIALQTLKENGTYHQLMNKYFEIDIEN